MHQIKQILCPVDRSPDSVEALRYALTLAQAYNAKLLLCHCVENHMPQPGRVATLDSKYILAEFAELLAEHIDRGHFDRIDWEGIVVESNHPASAITREAAERGVDLIVMRSRRRPRAAALLGSTAEAVCRAAPCPVFVTHPREREWVGQTMGEIDLRRILVAYDFSDDAELALRYGLSLAQEYQAEVHLLHVLQKPADDAPEIALTAASAEGVYLHAARRLQKAVPAEAYLSCRVVHSVRWGKPYREALAYAAEQEIDLICMGAKGAGFGMSALFGSNVDRVLRQAPCPVLVARPLKPAVEPANARAAVSLNRTECRLSAPQVAQPHEAA
jgi:nucleotide-binding universal stress UspA family protein